MQTSEALDLAVELLKPYTRSASRPAPDRLDVMVLPITLESAVWALTAARWGSLAAITGLDHPGAAVRAPEEAQWSHLSDEGGETGYATVREGTIEVLYHFTHKAAIVTLRVNVRYSFPLIPSICDILPAATLYERELSEMFGVQMVGAPNADRLLLPDDWPNGVYPLRKDFHGLELVRSEGGSS